MIVLMDLLILLGSIIVLGKSSHVVIENSVKLARMTRLGELVIGFLMIAIATSLPELAVSMSAILRQDVGIAVGNLFGSSIANITWILGVGAIVAPFTLRRKTMRKLSFMLLVTSVLPIMLLYLSEASRFIGLVFLRIFFIFTHYHFHTLLGKRENKYKRKKTKKT
jgi:cation:H+ antiporter